METKNRVVIKRSDKGGRIIYVNGIEIPFVTEYEIKSGYNNAEMVIAFDATEIVYED